jgi:diadenosine tetraphosphate (Ap4A) HIT family hydrolase
MVSGRIDGNHIIYQDNLFVAFLNKYPVLYGYALVAPIAHKEQVTADFTLEEYLALQRGVYQVAEAVRRTVETERVYILSLGSQQGNRHVHWHIAPLPYGVPFKEQQLEALRIENGLLDISDSKCVELAQRIRHNMALHGEKGRFREGRSLQHATWQAEILLKSEWDSPPLPYLSGLGHFPFPGLPLTNRRNPLGKIPLRRKSHQDEL